MVPLISSLCYGPLGYCQVPRTWWKCLLQAHGTLDSQYPPCTKMLDHWWLDGFGIKDEEMLEYVTSEKPDYLTFETWIRKTARREPNPAGRDSWNTLIRTRIHRPSKFYGITEDLGLDPAADLKSAVVLNHLEDWSYFHERDFPALSADSATAIPLISTLDYGRMGVCQLPRTWLKVILGTRGVLHPDYPGCGQGLDARVLQVLELDRDKTVDFLTAELPTYNAFEKWIQAHSRLNREAIREWNHFLEHRQHKTEKRKSILGFLNLSDDGSLTSAVVLNNIEDWQYAYRALTGLNR